MFRRLACIAAIMGCSGGGYQTDSAANSTNPSPEKESGDELFARVCVQCHIGDDDGIPDFTVDHLESAPLALAVNRLSMSRMPPPRSKVALEFTPDERRRLTDWLCLKTGRGQDQCDDIAAASVEPPVTRAGSAYRLMLEARAPAEVPGSIATMLEQPDGAAPTVPFTLRRPTVVAAILLGAVYGCRAETPEESRKGAGGSGPDRPRDAAKKRKLSHFEGSRECVEAMVKKGLEPPR